MVDTQLHKVRDTSDVLDVVADAQGNILYGKPFAPILHLLPVRLFSLHPLSHL